MKGRPEHGPRRALLLAGIAAALLCAHPGLGMAGGLQSFEFSYEFDDGKVIQGSFDGERTGDVVQNLSELRASYEGTSLGLLELPPLGCCEVSFDGSTMHLEGNGFDGSMLPVGFALKTGEIDIVVVAGAIVQPPVIPGSGLVFVPTRWTLSVKNPPVPSLDRFGLAALGLVLLGAAAVALRRRGSGSPRRDA